MRYSLGSRYGLLAVAILGVALWGGHVFDLRDTLYFDHLTLDSAAYDEWGREIAAGSWIGHRAFYQAPLYPYFLGVVYAVFGHDLLLVRILQVLIGVGTCVITGLIGRRLVGPLVGNISALVGVLYLPSIHHAGRIDKTGIAMFLIAAALLLSTYRTARLRLAAGFVFGLACLTRENFLFLLPFIVIGLIWSAWVGDSQSGRARSTLWQRARVKTGALRGLAAFVVGFAVVTGTVAFRNYFVGGHFTLTTSQAGQNFYRGNNPANRSGLCIQPSFVRSHPWFEQEDFLREAQVRTAKQLTPAEASRFWWIESFRHMREDPGWALHNFWQKVRWFFCDYEIADNQDLYFMRRFSWVLRLPLLTFGIIMPPAIVGLFVASRRARLLAYYVVLYSVSVILFCVVGRYRMPVLPALIVLAVTGWSWMIAKLHSRSWWRALIGLSIVAAATLFAFLSSPPRNTAFAHETTNLGMMHAQRGEFELARRTYNDALRHDPTYAVAHRNIGVLFLEMGDLEQAEVALRRAVTLKPDHPDAWLHLGNTLDRAGRVTEARSAYRRALSNTPGSVGAALALADAELRLGNPRAAVEIYTDLLTADPTVGPAYAGLSVACLRAGDLDCARQAAERARLLGTELPREVSERFGRIQ